MDAEGEPPVAADGEFGDHEGLADLRGRCRRRGDADPIEHSLDEELPAMDADDEGDFEDALMLETSEIAQDAHSLRWADAAWSECSSLNRPFTWMVGEKALRWPRWRGWLRRTSSLGLQRAGRSGSRGMGAGRGARSRRFRALGRSGRRPRAAFLGAVTRPGRKIAALGRQPSRSAGGQSRFRGFVPGLCGNRAADRRPYNARGRFARGFGAQGRDDGASRLHRRHHLVRQRVSGDVAALGSPKVSRGAMDGVSRRAGRRGRQPRSVPFPRRQALRSRAGHGRSDRRRVRGSRFEGDSRSLRIVRR